MFDRLMSDRQSWLLIWATISSILVLVVFSILIGNRIYTSGRIASYKKGHWDGVIVGIKRGQQGWHVNRDFIGGQAMEIPIPPDPERKHHESSN